MFCAHCGEKIAENATTCSKCGVAVKSAVDKDDTPATTNAVYKRFRVQPLTAVSFVLAAISFLFGFILVTISFVKGFMVAPFDMIIIFPAYTAVALSIYQLVGDLDKHNKALACVSLGLAAFVILYTFISYAI